MFFFLFPLITYFCRTDEKKTSNFTANGHWSLKTRCPTDSPTSRYSRSLPLIITANDTRLTDWLIDHQLSKQRIHSWLIDWVLLIVNAQSTVTVMFRQTQFITSKVLFTVRVKHYFTLEENWKNEVEWAEKEKNGIVELMVLLANKGHPWQLRFVRSWDFDIRIRFLNAEICIRWYWSIYM